MLKRLSSLPYVFQTPAEFEKALKIVPEQNPHPMIVLKFTVKEKAITSMENNRPNF